jgi:hypothetical protein
MSIFVIWTGTEAGREGSKAEHANKATTAYADMLPTFRGQRRRKTARLKAHLPANAPTYRSRVFLINLR